MYAKPKGDAKKIDLLYLTSCGEGRETHSFILPSVSLLSSSIVKQEQIGWVVEEWQDTKK